MARVSKVKLDKENKQALTKQFVKVLRDGKIDDVFDDFFTETEKMMFIKRMAAILMADADYTSYRIAKTLHISENTAAKIKDRVRQGAYDAILRRVKSKKFDTEKFWVVVDVLVRAGMPPIAGRDRWDHVPGMGGK